MKDGIISKEDYKELHAAYEQRKKNAEIAIHQIELEMDDVLNRRIFNMFLDGKGYAGIAKTLQYEGILSPPKYRFYKSGKIELAEKARELFFMMAI